MGKVNNFLETEITTKESTSMAYLKGSVNTTGKMEAFTKEI